VEKSIAPGFSGFGRPRGHISPRLWQNPGLFDDTTNINKNSWFHVFTDDELAGSDAITDLDSDKIAALVGFAIISDLTPMLGLCIERSVRKYLGQRASDLRQTVK